jgi:hypothetical protein
MEEAVIVQTTVSSALGRMFMAAFIGGLWRIQNNSAAVLAKFGLGISPIGDFDCSATK